jgi:hypothetical protein
VERYKEDKMWLLLGMAIQCVFYLSQTGWLKMLIRFFQSCRMGTDLNLDRKTAVTSQDTQKGKARGVEVHNRERT